MVPNASARALAQLSDYLGRDGIGEGDRLPPERELATTLGVSRRALRAALGRLEIDGVVWRGVGQGTFLGRPPRKSGAGALPPSRPLDIMQARLLFEPPLAELAAIGWDPHELKAIEIGVQRCGEVQDASDWRRWDGRFHRAIAQASHNPLLVAMSDQLDHSRDMTDWGQLRDLITTPAMRARATAEHRVVYQAIADRSPERAHAAMRAHLTTIRTAIEDAVFRASAAPIGP